MSCRPTRRLGRAITALLVLGCGLGDAALGQTSRSDDGPDESLPAPPLTATVDVSKDKSQGKVAGSAVGRAGERQTRATVKGVVPTARVDNRIANRVQSRLRNRIDRDYDPQANAISPFASAVDKLKRSGQGGPR
ncbi:MAG: hypothetical protein K2X76_01050 [Sphingomonas sp.]|nr:hypothetical protein [Sphingomonas sp.]